MEFYEQNAPQLQGGQGNVLEGSQDFQGQLHAGRTGFLQQFLDDGSYQFLREFHRNGGIGDDGGDEVEKGIGDRRFHFDGQNAPF